MDISCIYELYRRLFGGRKDVYTLHSLTLSGKENYHRVCRSISRLHCHSGLAQCKGCQSRSFVPFSAPALEDHLSGRGAVGIYPVDSRNECRFCTIYLEGEEFTLRLRLLAAVCVSMGITHFCELTDFGRKGRLWLVFGDDIPCGKAAFTAAMVITQAMAFSKSITPELLSAVHPFIPGSGDFGKPVILPLFDMESGYSVVTDDELNPIEDAVEFFDGLRPEALEVKLYELKEGDLPKRIDVELCDMMYVNIRGLSRPALTALWRLGSCLNPKREYEFGSSVPILADSAAVSGGRLGLPRGAVCELFRLCRPFSDICISDGRSRGKKVRLKLQVSFDEAVENTAKAALNRSLGVIAAPVGSGKTKVIGAIMAALQRSTLILTTEKSAALRWKQRLAEMFGLSEQSISCILTDVDYPNGGLDVAVLGPRTELWLSEYLHEYGLVVAADVDRLHCGGDIFRQVMENVCAEKIYAVSSKPVDSTRYGGLVRLYCGEDINM